MIDAEEDGWHPKCWDCERRLHRRHLNPTPVHIPHDEGMGYDVVPVPLCDGCRKERVPTHECERCGEEWLNLTDAVECCQHRAGALLPDGGRRFTFDHPCDGVDEDGHQCGATPTAHVGDIYYACEDHYDEQRGLLADGGAEDGGEPPMAEGPGISALAPDPDPETCHPDDLLGRRIRVDWGAREDVGEITEVRDHHERDRELSIRIPTEQGRRMQTFAPARTDCELVEADDE